MGLAAMGLMGCGGYGRGPGEKSEVGEDEVRERWGRGRSIVRGLRRTRQHDGGLGRHARERGIFIVVSWNVEGGRARVRMDQVESTVLQHSAVQRARVSGTARQDRVTVLPHVIFVGRKSDQSDGDQVSDGDTGHAESVQVQYNPAQISYGQLLQVFFSVALDPTELNRQGPDSGTQYRSVIFYGSDEQKKIATAYIAQLTAAKSFSAPIVTQVVPLQAFYPAEGYHQHYASLHPDDLYILYNDAPKVTHLKQQFPALYQDEQHVVDVQLH